MLSLRKTFPRTTALLARPVNLGIASALLLLLASGAVSYWTYTVRVHDERQEVANAASDARDALRVALLHGLSATQTVELCVRQGLLPAGFDSIAPLIASAYGTIDAIELAPDGVVGNVFPYEQNKRALGFNILADPIQKDEALLAIRDRTLIFAGPLELVQGGLAVVGRGPVFIPSSGVDTFWGFTIVIIRVPSLVSNAHLHDLQARGFDFRLLRHDPISGQMKCFYNQDVVLAEPLTATIPVPNGEWEIEVAPVDGWRAGIKTIPISFLSVFLSALGGLFVWFLRRQPERLKAQVEVRAAALGRSESRFATLIEQAPVGITMSRNGTLLYANPSFSQIVGASPQKSLIGRDLGEFLGPALDKDETYGRHEITDRNSSSRGECRPVRRTDGIVTFVEISHTPVDLHDGMAEVGFIIDITERTLSEKKITDSLKEKVTLLKEIHHRVKNNLQVISSLLSIQATHVEDHRAREAFQDSIRRVRSMALVHERLYRSGDLSQIDFAQYISSVTTDLAHTLHSPGIAVRVEAEQIMVGLDIAIPCGLIANELVTNALKHAYGGGVQGTVRVGFQKLPNGDLQLEVADDGVGLPAGSDVNSMTSMGITIVRTLADQIGATLSVASPPGTHFTVTFRG
jgi:PAS domain S-box-containing protein